MTYGCHLLMHEQLRVLTMGFRIMQHEIINLVLLVVFQDPIPDILKLGPIRN